MFDRLEDISLRLYQSDIDQLKALGVRQDTLNKLFPELEEFVVGCYDPATLTLHQAQNLYLLKHYCNQWLVFTGGITGPIPNVTKLLYLPVPELGKSILQAMEEDIGWYEKLNFTAHMRETYYQIINQQSDEDNLDD